MDADDVSRFDRFEKQLSIFANIDVDVCSSWVSEFVNNEFDIISYKKVPMEHQDIVVFSQARSPVNHPAVMFKKSSVLRAGGYKHMPWLEDYYLWLRMILDSSEFFNIQEPLVNMRVGAGQISRRAGLGYARSEFKIQRFLLHNGLTNKWHFYSIGLAKIIFRLAPKFLVKFVYQKLRDDV